MFTEHEIDSLMEIPEIKDASLHLKNNFIRKEVPYLHISDNDFLALIMMTPSISMAKADGKVTLFEELALNKKARKLSKGAYFLKKDPVIYAMEFLIKRIEDWEDDFYKVLNLVLNQIIELCSYKSTETATSSEISYEDFKREVFKTPYVLIQFLSFFFLDLDENILKKRKSIRKIEHQKMHSLGLKIGLNKIYLYQILYQSYTVK